MNKQLRETIEELIRLQERDVGLKLSIESFDFLVSVCLNFVHGNISKFINGAAEHGDDFLTSVDHAGELQKEILDSANYLAALVIKMRKFDQRFH